MNNSKLALDEFSLAEEPQKDIKPQLRKREEDLLKLIEALRGVQQSAEWSTLKTELFDNLVNVLEKDIRDEGKRENPDALKLNRMAGQLKWAEKYADLTKLENVFRQELSGIRKNLYGPEFNG